MNPYLLDLPAVVSFSGGRTSGFMLRRILDAHDGQPRDLKVCFENTGLEHPATYSFIERVAKEWGVDVSWLEYCVDEENQHSFKVVTPETAARAGEPFDALIAKKQFLPNPVARICTVNLKMWTLIRYLKTLPEFEDGWTNAIGLRYDEPRRVHRMKGDYSQETPCCPMYEAKHTEADVLDWWRQQPFDLELPHGLNLFGNCVGCYLKGRGKLEMIALEEPHHLEWWVRAEAKALGSAPNGGRFRSDRPTYAAMLAQVQAQGVFDWGDDDTIPCMCSD